MLAGKIFCYLGFGCWPKNSLSRKAYTRLILDECFLGECAKGALLSVRGHDEETLLLKKGLECGDGEVLGGNSGSKREGGH